MASAKATRVIIRDWIGYAALRVSHLIGTSRYRSARSFRGWRRSRPFWGGLLLLLGGLELLLIPLSGILLHGQVKLVVYIGIGGVFGLLIGALMVTCGLLLWLTPAHRTFYAIAGALLAMLSFITSNLGGFFLGMLLGITGGSLAFAWAPVAAVAPVAEEPDAPGAASGAAGHHPGRLMATAALPMVLAGALLTGHVSVRHAVGQQSGLMAATATSVITAGSATLNGLAYQGAAKVPTANGTQTMMKFTLDSMTLSGDVTGTVTENGQTTVTQNSSLTFTGGVTLYATKLSGSLLGVPVTLTPKSVISLLLQVLKTLTPLVPVTLTDVTTDQPFVLSGALQAANLVITG